MDGEVGLVGRWPIWVYCQKGCCWSFNQDVSCLSVLEFRTLQRWGGLEAYFDITRRKHAQAFSRHCDGMYGIDCHVLGRGGPLDKNIVGIFFFVGFFHSTMILIVDYMVSAEQGSSIYIGRFDY